MITYEASLIWKSVVCQMLSPGYNKNQYFDISKTFDFEFFRPEPLDFHVFAILILYHQISVIEFHCFIRSMVQVALFKEMSMIVYPI